MHGTMLTWFEGSLVNNWSNSWVMQETPKNPWFCVILCMKSNLQVVFNHRWVLKHNCRKQLALNWLKSIPERNEKWSNSGCGYPWSFVGPLCWQRKMEVSLCCFLFSWKTKIKVSVRIFQDYLWGYLSLWMLGNGDVLQAATLSFTLLRGQESRSEVLPSLLLSCSLSLLTSYELFFLLGCCRQSGDLAHLEGQFPKRQRTYGLSGLLFAGKICLGTPLRIELVVRTLKFRWEHCWLALMDFSIFCISSAIWL